VGTSSEYSASSAYPQPTTSCVGSTSFYSIHPRSLGLEHCLELYIALTRMARLDDAIIVLDLLGSVVQAVPAVGENLKSATEIAKKLCEMVKVRLFLGAAPALDMPCRR
jgi:hypothetical protein